MRTRTRAWAHAHAHIHAGAHTHTAQVDFVVWVLLPVHIAVSVYAQNRARQDAQSIWSKVHCIYSYTQIGSKVHALHSAALLSSQCCLTIFTVLPYYPFTSLTLPRSQLSLLSPSLTFTSPYTTPHCPFTNPLLPPHCSLGARRVRDVAVVVSRHRAALAQAALRQHLAPLRQPHQGHTVHRHQAGERLRAAEVRKSLPNSLVEHATPLAATHSTYHARSMQRR